MLYDPASHSYRSVTKYGKNQAATLGTQRFVMCLKRHLMIFSRKLLPEDLIYNPIIALSMQIETLLFATIELRRLNALHTKQVNGILLPLIDF